MWRGRQGKDSKDAGSQLVAIAVNESKSSQQALKWAADHLISKTQIVLLIHVRRKITSIPTPSGIQLSILEVDEDVASAFIEDVDLRTKELLLPFQCFCSRRGLQCKEIILDENDIPKAIIAYVVRASIDKLILGASSRNAFTRAFKQADVPTSVSKIAPDFCSVYVISKGKLSSVRPAHHPNIHSTGKQLSCKFESPRSALQSAKSDPIPSTLVEEIVKSSFSRSANFMREPESGAGAKGYDDIINHRINRVGKDGERLDFSYHSVSSCPSPTRTIIDRPSYYPRRGHVDSEAQQPRWSNNKHDEYPYHDVRQMKSFNSKGLDGENYSYHDDQMRSFESNRSGELFCLNRSGSGSGFSGWGQQLSGSSVAGGDSWSSQSLDDLESEIRRIKLELRQKREIYSGTYQEILNTRDRDFHLWPAEQEHRKEGTSFSEEVVEEKPIRAVLESTQVSKSTTNLEETVGHAGRKCLLEEEEKRKVLESMSRYRRYTLEEIEKATGNFSEKLKIGEGGYGPVFKSTLDHTLVAIKILQSNVTLGMRQFHQEIEVLSCIRHPNMVLLLGACPDHGCLVYEYMANGSLEDRLFCKDNTPPLSWQVRFKIAYEIATGLIFLHQNKPEPLVHRDLKPDNILLDQNFVSKIADVGLARLIPPSVADALTQYRMTVAAGTFCYIDPEYQKTCLLDIKSDIYALGIIFLQLITAKAPMGLAHNVEQALEDDTFEEILDPKVPDWPMEETVKFASLALKCAELRRKDRPNLGNVLPELIRMRDLAKQVKTGPRFALHG